MKKKDAKQTKEDILKAALYVFEEKTYEKSSLNDIAKRAGVTRGAIYWHFKNKFDIFDELSKIYLEKVYNDMALAIEESDGNTKEKIKIFYNEYLDTIFYNEDYRRYKTIIEFKVSQSKEIEKITNVFIEYSEKYKIIIEKVIEDGKKCGEIRDDVDNDFLSMSILNWLIGFERLYLLQKDLYNLKEKKESTITNIIKMIEA